MSKSLIRKNQLHPDISDLVSGYGTGFFITPEQLNDAIDTSQQIITQGAVLISGNQNISGSKNFVSRPTYNSTGLLISSDLNNLVYATGNQNISGVKKFLNNSYFGNNEAGLGQIIFSDNGYGDELGFLTENDEVLSVTSIDGSFQYGGGVPNDAALSFINATGNFKIRPTVNGTGVLLQGEAAGGGSVIENVVYTTGNQTVSGDKTFTNSTIQLSSSSGIHIIPSQDIMSQINDYDINLQSYPYANTYVSIGLNTGKLGESINNFDGNIGTREIKFWERGGFFAETTGVFIRLGRSGVIISENQDSKVGIGTRFPKEKVHISGGNLRVDGSTSFIGNIKYGFGSGLVDNGFSILMSNVSGDRVSFVRGGNVPTPHGYGIIFDGGDINNAKGYLTAGTTSSPQSYNYARLDWVNRILSGQWKTNERLLVNNSGVLLKGEDLIGGQTVGSRNIFSISNTGIGSTFAGEIILSGASATGVGVSPNAGGDIKFIGGSGGQGISGNFQFIGESIRFNDFDFVVNKDGSVICPHVTTYVDINNITTNFEFLESFNSKILTINSSQNITGTIPFGLDLSGYNVSFVQMGAGQLRITGEGGVNIRQRLNLYSTAGQYAVASLLHRGDDEYILYGDLI